VIYGGQEGSIRDVARLDHVDLRIEPSSRNDTCGGNFDLRPAQEDRLTLFAHDIPGLLRPGGRGLRIHEFALRWPEACPAFFTHGIQCERCSDVDVHGFDGSPARTGDDLPTILLKQVRGASIRDSVARVGTSTFLSAPESTDVRLDQPHFPVSPGSPGH